MHRRAMSGLWRTCVAFAVFAFAAATRAQTLEPIVYTVTISKPASHTAEVEATFPTSGRPAIEIMMPVWSPGYYRVEDYAGRVQDLSAKSPDGAELKVDHPQKNHWRIETGGNARVTVDYRLVCDRSSVTSDYVGESFAMFNGAPTFITLVGQARRPHDIRFKLPPAWKQTMTALEPAGDHSPHHYRAGDYDTLVDSPVVAGNPSIHEFEVNGSKHLLVDIGETGPWDGERAAKELRKLVEENRRLWGFLPFQRYVFLNVFRRGGGGLEHKSSTLLLAAPPRTPYAARNFRWLSFVSHEYFHAFNVKRLRPVELGPFDYEHPPRTSSLWIAEGFTSYYGELIVVRSGLGTTDDFLTAVSSHIDQLQHSPGRLVQSLEQSSLDVWSSGVSGVGRNREKTVDYYVKGPIVGFLLDARVRRATGGKKSLDDVMRQAYKLYAGERGFTPNEFRLTAQEIAGADLKEWYRKNISSAEELDYTEALDWFGLRFAPDPPPDPEAKQKPKKKWKLEVREGATDSQKAHLKKLTAPSGKA
jgi:predicted metalloprotease with PDZ domain